VTIKIFSGWEIIKVVIDVEFAHLHALKNKVVQNMATRYITLVK
jgi:hypothetical protein